MTIEPKPGAFPARFGSATRRVEDQPLIMGTGQFVTDIQVPGMTHAVVVRSSVAHARFTLQGVEEARAAPGVVGVLTHAEIAHLPHMPVAPMVKNADGSPIWPARHEMLCSDTVRYVGDAIAFVVAESLAEAKLAAEMIYADYEEQSVVVDMPAATDASAPLVWPEHGTNIAFDWDVGDADKTSAALANADQVIELDIINNRLVCNYMEPRACIAEYNEAADSYKLTAGSQGVHVFQGIIGKLLGIGKDKFHVVTPDDVGGGFGTKIFVYREYPLSLVAAKVFGRPVKWVGERAEHFLSCAHGRDNLAHVRLGIRKDGTFTGIDIDLLANMGAYLNFFGPFIPTLGAAMAVGCYHIPDLYMRVRGVYTHTVPTDAYRGAGRPEATYLIERLVDHAAYVLGLSVDEIRRRNFVRPDMMPYATPVGRTYDTGDFDAHMREAMQLTGWSDIEARADAALAQGKLRGIGMGVYIESCAAGGEDAKVLLNPDGGLTILIGTQATGQGHRTAYAQIASGLLGVDVEKITVIQGDTARVRTGGGTGGSKSVTMGGVSVHRASEAIADKIRERAAELLEAAPGDIELVEGTARVVGTDRIVPLAQIAEAAAQAGDEIDGEARYDSPHWTFPNGTHVAEVEIDTSTGQTTITNYVIVDDFGAVANPLLLEGQIHGGVAQGIGQALLEHTVFDPDSGQLLSGSFMDYCMPRADDIPQISFQMRNIPCLTNPLGMKGAGEAGTIGACPAVINAIVNALHRHNGTTHIDMPATPETVWRAIHALPPRQP